VRAAATASRDVDSRHRPLRRRGRRHEMQSGAPEPSDRRHRRCGRATGAHGHGMGRAGGGRDWGVGSAGECRHVSDHTASSASAMMSSIRSTCGRVTDGCP
jgi:hypothetical protein